VLAIRDPTVRASTITAFDLKRTYQVRDAVSGVPASRVIRELRDGSSLEARVRVLAPSVPLLWGARRWSAPGP